VSNDGILFKNDVEKAFRKELDKNPKKSMLLLLNVRLGLDNLNSVYHEALKVCLSLPRNVLIVNLVLE
jgi:hypothetical protein